MGRKTKKRLKRVKRRAAAARDNSTRTGLIRSRLEWFIESLPTLILYGLLVGGIAIYVYTVPEPPPRKPVVQESEMEKSLKKLTPQKRREVEEFLKDTPEPVFRKKEPWEQ